MKKVVLTALMAVSFCLAVKVTWAACMGPFCWDDQGAYIGGFINDGNGQGIPVLSSSTIAGLKPRAIGQEVLCNSCTGSTVNGYTMCISTSTTAPAYVTVSSVTRVCN